MSSILGQSEDHGADLWPLLTKALEVSPKGLECIPDQVLALALTPNEDKEEDVETFLAALIPAFEKLRRFTKFVLRLLVVLRQKKVTRMTPMLAKISALVGPAVGRFKAGQITTLWRALQKNAEEEALKILNADVGKLIIFYGTNKALVCLSVC